MENRLRQQYFSAAGNKAWAKWGPRDYFCLPILSQNLKVMKCCHWKKQLESGNGWKRIIEQAKTYKELWRRRRRF